LAASREVYDVAVQFFDHHLGRSGEAAASAPDSELEKTLGTQVDRFVASDKISPPAPCQYLFIGSSSIVKWVTLAKDMAPLPVINRGLGGAHVEYVNRWFDELIRPYRPRAIVFYAGENDLAAGKSVERVINDFDAFMVRKREALGDTPVYFISIKPSKLRFDEFARQSAINDEIHAQAQHSSDLHFIDVVTSMLDDGHPKSLFADDGLHMDADGYAVWTRAVKGALTLTAQQELQSCQMATSQVGYDPGR
jgi:hypothetical protein